MRRGLLFTCLVFISPLLVFLQSCIVCGDFVTRYNYIDDLSGEVMEIIGAKIYEGSSGEYFDLIDVEVDKELPYDSIAFLITIEADGKLSFVSPKFSGSLLACSPPPDYINEIASGKIISNNDFTSEYPAGTDLSPLFSVREFYGVPGFPVNWGDHPLYYAHNEIVWNFTLNQAPDEAGQFDFIFVYTTQKNQHFEEKEFQTKLSVAIQP